MIGARMPLLQLRGPLGIPIQLSPSLLAVFPVLLLIGGGGDLVFQATLIGILLVSVFVHEMGHAAAALMQRVKVTRIVLNFSGGYCEYHLPPSDRAHLLTLLGGPLANMALLAVALLLYSLVDHPDMDRVMVMVAAINLGLAALNLVPVFPTDGGRIVMLLLGQHFEDRQVCHVMGGTGLVALALWAGGGAVAALILDSWIWLVVGALPLSILPRQFGLLRSDELPETG